MLFVDKNEIGIRSKKGQSRRSQEFWPLHKLFLLSLILQVCYECRQIFLKHPKTYHRYHARIKPGSHRKICWRKFFGPMFDTWNSFSKLFATSCASFLSSKKMFASWQRNSGIQLNQWITSFCSLQCHFVRLLFALFPRSLLFCIFYFVAVRHTLFM